MTTSCPLNEHCHRLVDFKEKCVMGSHADCRTWSCDPVLKAHRPVNQFRENLIEVPSTSNVSSTAVSRNAGVTLKIDTAVEGSNGSILLTASVGRVGTTLNAVKETLTIEGRRASL